MSQVIEPIARTHDRTGFDCGVESLNRFLHQQVTQYEKRNFGRTFVLVETGTPHVLGYYTLAAAQLSLSDLPEGQAKKLPRHPIPAILLGRLAVDQTMRGKGIGSTLLRDALRRCLMVSEQIGAFAVYVEAISDEAAEFYRKFEFDPLPPNPHQLILTISDLKRSSGT